MQPTTRFLQGTANDVYDRVFVPLAKEVGIIKASKEAYSCFPFVKLRTVNEGDPKLVQVGFSIVDSSYDTRLNSIKTGAAKLCTETRNLCGSTVNLFLTNWMWNCLSTKTALTLDTATNAFSKRVGEVKAEIEQGSSLQELQDLKKEIGDLQATLNSALKTVFYIYRTYNLLPDAKTEGLATSDELQTLRPQYRAISALIGELDSLLETTVIKLNPPKTIELSSSEGGSIPGEIIFPIPDTTLISPNAMADKTLVFRSREAALTWFKSTLARCTDAQTVSGTKCHSNLMMSAKIATVVPQQFLAFAKTLDNTIKDRVVHYDTVQEVCERFKAIAEANRRPLQLKAHNSFKSLFKELCTAAVGREVYQDFFRALLNKEGTAPFGLQCEAALLNAIMNSVYFPMFDPEQPLP